MDPQDHPYFNGLLKEQHQMSTYGTDQPDGSAKSWRRLIDLARKFWRSSWPDPGKVDV